MSSSPRTLDAARLLSWARRGSRALEGALQEINRINVFPVADSDTGSNMAHTMSQAVAAANTAERLGEDTTAALVTGAVRGARGNSGVVLSQVLRAAASNTDLPSALNLACELVEEAITDHVEGTALSVLRSAGESASRSAVNGDDLLGQAQSALHAAQEALGKTTEQLPALKAAGVVDAGGQGIVVLLRALVDDLTNGEPISELAADNNPHTHTAAAAGQVEVMFQLTDADFAATEETLNPLGTSLVIGRESEHSARVHIHTADPGAVIGAAFTHGAVSNIHLEVLDDHSFEVIALSPPGELAELFSTAGARVATDAPDVEVLLSEVLDSSGSAIVLPNGQITDEELTSMITHGVFPVATEDLVTGLAALTVWSRNDPLGLAIYAMNTVAAEMRSAGSSLADLTETCRKLLAAGGEQVTVVHRPEITVDTDKLGRELGVEVTALSATGLPTEVEIGVE